MSKSLFLKFAITLLAATALTTVFTMPASAVSDGAVGIRPANELDFFHLSVAPGGTLVSTAIVSNQAASPVTLTIYSVDAVNTSDGGFAFQNSQVDATGAGLWMNTGAPTITVKAHSELRIPVTLTVPPRTVPGDYAGGVIIQSAPIVGSVSPANKQGAVSRIDVVERQGLRVYLHVTGRATNAMAPPTLHWTANASAVNFTMELTNTGTTILHPKATVLVASRLGTAPLKLTFNTPEQLLPGGVITIHAQLKHPPQIEVASLKARLNSEAGSADPLGDLILVNWWIILGVVVGCSLLGFGAWRTFCYLRVARVALRRVASFDTPETGSNPK